MRWKMLVFVMAMMAIVLFKAAPLTGGEETTRSAPSKDSWEPKIPHATENSFTLGKFVLVYRGTRLNDGMKKSIRVFEEEQERYNGRVQFLLHDVDKNPSLCPGLPLPEEISYFTVDVEDLKWKSTTRQVIKNGKTVTASHTEIGSEDLQAMLQARWRIKPEIVAKTATKTGTNPASPAVPARNGTGGARTGASGAQQN